MRPVTNQPINRLVAEATAEGPPSVHPRRKTQADQEPLGRHGPGDGLAPWLLTGFVQQREPGRFEFCGAGGYGINARELELDGGAWNR